VWLRIDNTLTHGTAASNSLNHSHHEEGDVMKNSKFWIAVAASGVVMNIVDFLLQGMVMIPMYYSKHTDIFNQTTNPVWYVIGDFITVFVLAWVFDKVSASFNSTWKGGAVYGLYAGILVNFPTWIFLHLFLKGYSYKYAWFSTIYGIVWTVIAGAIVASIYEKGSAAPARS
jgi:hypothetical protein